jgi:hypothetical protein
MKTARLVQILLPTTETSKSSSVFEELAQELTARFGGVTSYIHSPAEGRWKMGRRTEHDDITVIEVMTDKVDPKYWKALRGELERKLGQEEIIIRSQLLQRL